VGYMSFDLFCHVVDQLCGRDAIHVNLHLSGEPLLHPQIAEMVRYAKEVGLSHVRFATNATLLGEGISRDLIEAGLDALTVSMDASTVEKYMHRKEAAEFAAKLDRNILRFIALRNQSGLGSPKVHMQIIQMSATQNLVDDFVQKWQAIADSVTIKPLLSWAGHIKVPNRGPSRRFICVNHLMQGVVQWDGDVSFCCLYIDSRGDSAGIIGHARHSSLDDIFLSAKRKQIVDAQVSGNYDMVPYCKNCPDWRDFLDREQPFIGRLRELTI
jgi:hypothetical protein